MQDDVSKIKAVLKDLADNNISGGDGIGLTPDDVVDSVLYRLAQAMTDEDMKALEDLDQQDKTGNSVKYYILSKFPNFDAIMKEEVTKYRESLHQ